MAYFKDLLKDSLPSFITLCVMTVFALSFFIFCIVFLARKKSSRKAFHKVISGFSFLTLFAVIVMSIAAVFYSFPNSTLSFKENGELIIFTKSVNVWGIGITAKFLCSAVGAVILGVCGALNILFIILIHIKPVKRKKTSETAEKATGKIKNSKKAKRTEENLKVIKAKETNKEEEAWQNSVNENEPHSYNDNYGIKNSVISSGAEFSDSFLKMLDEENLDIQLDELVSIVKEELADKEDVSGFMIKDDKELKRAVEFLNNEEEKIYSSHDINKNDLTAGLEEELKVQIETESEKESEQFEKNPEEEFLTPADDISALEKRLLFLKEQEKIQLSELRRIEKEKNELKRIAAVASIPEKAYINTEKNPQNPVMNTEKTNDNKTKYDAEKALVVPVKTRTIVRNKTLPDKPVADENISKAGTAPKKTAAAKKPAAKKSSAKKTSAQNQENKNVVIEVRDVEIIESGLPVNKRYVVRNRQNAVNVFSEYLKTKDKEEKDRLANSLNTIILK